MFNEYIEKRKTNASQSLPYTCEAVDKGKVRKLEPSAKGLFFQLYVDGIGVLTFILYMSAILSACRYIFDKDCFPSEDTVYEDIRTFLRYEFFIFIFGMIALGVFLTCKWIIHHFGGFRIRALYEALKNSRDSFEKD